MLHTVKCVCDYVLYKEVWPTQLPCVPSVGDFIQSSFKHKSGFQLELSVSKIVWKFDKTYRFYVPSIQLIYPYTSSMSFATSTTFYAYYAENIGIEYLQDDIQEDVKNYWEALKEI